MTKEGWRTLGNTLSTEDDREEGESGSGSGSDESEGSDGPGISSVVEEADAGAYPEPERSQIADFVSGIVYRWRWLLVIFWPALAAVSCVYAPKLMETVVPMDKQPPPGTDSFTALDAFLTHFPNLMGVQREMVVIRCKTRCDTPVGVLSKGFVEEIQDVVKRFGQDHPGTIIHMHSYYTYGDALDKNPMLSHDGQSILYEWEWQVPHELKIKAEGLCATILNLIKDINAFQANKGPGQLEVRATGPTFIKYSMRDVLANELPIHEFSVLPFSLGVLAWQLRSIKMLIFPLLGLAISAPIAYAAVYFISLHVTVTSHAPMMMILLCSALSLDYSLFLLTRYTEERGNGFDVQRCVQEMISGSGPVVVLSGVVLVVAYAAMLFLPSSAKTFAVAASSMIIVCVLVQLTFVPALMASCPKLGAPRGRRPKRIVVGDDEDDQEAMRVRLKDAMANVAALAEQKEHESPLERAKPHMQGPWYRMGQCLTTFPINILVPIIIYSAMMPLTLRLLKFKPGHGFELAVPRHGLEWATALEVQRDFSGDVGAFFPMLLLSTEPKVPVRMLQDGTTPAPQMNDVRQQRFFDLNCRMVETLINATKGSNHALGAEDFRSPTFYGKSASGGVQCLSYWETHMFRKSFVTHHMLTSKLLQQLWDELVSDKHDAMLTILYPNMDAFSEPAFDLVRDIRKTLARDSESLGHLKFYTFSGTGIEMDTIEIMSSALPIAFGCCALVCFGVIAMSFGAALIPLKLFFTVAFPISWSYGAALYVFEDGVLSWTGWEQLSPVSHQGLSWIAPMFTLTITLGLALDYDVFYFSRIWEYRMEGFGDRESIVLGLAATGPIITAAGVIFAITFSSLLLASIPLINHMGFLMAFTVIVDTYVVRTMLVPAMLSLSPGLNYWPNKMPKPRYRLF